MCVVSTNGPQWSSSFTDIITGNLNRIVQHFEKHKNLGKCNFCTESLFYHQQLANLTQCKDEKQGFKVD